MNYVNFATIANPGSHASTEWWAARTGSSTAARHLHSKDIRSPVFIFQIPPEDLIQTIQIIQTIQTIQTIQIIQIIQIIQPSRDISQHWHPFRRFRLPARQTIRRTFPIISPWTDRWIPTEHASRAWEQGSIRDYTGQRPEALDLGPEWISFYSAKLSCDIHPRLERVIADAKILLLAPVQIYHKNIIFISWTYITYYKHYKVIKYMWLCNLIIYTHRFTLWFFTSGEAGKGFCGSAIPIG